VKSHAIVIAWLGVCCGGCPAEAAEDLREARQDLKQAGRELGQAAAKTAVGVDETAKRAGVRVSDHLEEAPADLDATRRIVDAAAETLVDPPDPPDSARLDDAIRCTPERCAIDRTLYDRTLANPYPLVSQVRIEAVSGAGALAGYRLVEVEPDSIPARLGFRAGDVIVAVDNIHLNRPPTTAMLTHLEDSDEITVTLERDGIRFDKTFVITPTNDPL
jgi:membrane-associated protease RseP (regulator of RpoE activity)